jgi:D-cysteine desulfhydrase
MRLEIDLERVRLGTGPTPVRQLRELADQGGTAPVWIKDDGTYSDVGGNKARKLEWLLADAQRHRKRAVITGGALGTNHGLATATFAARLGMRTILVLAPQPETEHVRAQLARLRASGAELHFAPGFVTSFPLAAWLIAARVARGQGSPYRIPPGGSNALGSIGYVDAAVELAGQIETGAIPEPSHVVVPLGSGGTSAGLVAGLRLAGLRSRLVCVLVSDVIRMDAARIAARARRTLSMLRRHGADVGDASPSAGDVTVETKWLGPGYGHSTQPGDRAMRLFSESVGVELEPVYTAKAVAAMLELNRRAAFGAGPVLYWHTYSPPAPCRSGLTAPRQRTRWSCGRSSSGWRHEATASA